MCDVDKGAVEVLSKFVLCVFDSIAVITITVIKPLIVHVPVVLYKELNELCHMRF